MNTDWRTPQEVFQQNSDLDPHLRAERNHLLQQQAHETKLATAIEAGRCYGLRAQKSQMQLKKQLTTLLRHPPVSPMW